MGSMVYDPYGRVLGRLVSVESEIDGTVTSIAIESDDREVRFYPAKAVRIEEGKLVVWPDWKVLAAETIKSYQTALRRIRGLEEMKRKNEISDIVYNELKKKLEAGLARVREEAKKLKEMIKSRMNELDDEGLRIERAIASLKVSYLAGEIPDNAYDVAIKTLRAAKDAISKEVEDLKSTLSRLEAVEKGIVGGEGVEEKAKPSPPEAPPSRTQPSRPIAVKIINEQ
jgi:hypothetical protein